MDASSKPHAPSSVVDYRYPSPAQSTIFRTRVWGVRATVCSMLQTQRTSHPMPSSLGVHQLPHNHPHQLPQLKEFDASWTTFQWARGGRRDGQGSQWSKDLADKEVAAPSRPPALGLTAHMPPAGNLQLPQQPSHQPNGGPAGQDALESGSLLNARPGIVRQTSRNQPFYHVIPIDGQPRCTYLPSSSNLQH